METIVIVVHIVIALAIIGLILMQQGKGADAGASFGGGASQTVFGSQGGGNFFAKVTAVLATVFFVTSFTLTVIAKNQSQVSVDDGVPAIEQVQESEIPSVGSSPADSTESDLPVVNTETESDIPASQN